MLHVLLKIRGISNACNVRIPMARGLILNIHNIVCNESCYTWLSHVSYTNDSCLICEWVTSFIWMGWFCMMSHVTRMTESCLTYEWVISHIWMDHVSYMTESSLIYEWVMSYMWMSHVSYMNAACQSADSNGVAFAKEPYKRDCILQKRPIIRNTRDMSRISRIPTAWVYIYITYMKTTAWVYVHT